MNFFTVLAAAAFSGFLGLSYEILWVRVFSFATGGTAASFGVVLGAFLLGLAAGSFASWGTCRLRPATGDARHLRIPAALLLLGSVQAFLVIPALAWIVRTSSFSHALPLISVAAASQGAVLPLLSQFGIRPDADAGARLSYLYVANILGSVSGSLLTGFVLLDRLSLTQVSRLMALLGIGLATALFAVSRPRARAFAAWGAIAGISACSVVASTPSLYSSLYEKLQFKHDYDPGWTFADVIETRSSVITVERNGTVSGGGVYDGAINVDLLHDPNLVVRAYALAALHPDPRRVLMIGLSSGSWAQVIAHHPSLERLVVVEINPGYLKLIPRHPAVASLLVNPKVEIVIDDGRRWLRANPNETFDAIVQNTSWHWRAHMTELLSMEYLELVKHHLKPGGVFYYNTTWSLAAQKTGCTSFPFGLRFVNCLAVSESPLRFERERWRSLLATYAIDGRPIFDMTNANHRARLEEVVRMGEPGPVEKGGRTLFFEPCSSVLKWTVNEDVITDDNMEPEWYRPWWATPSASPSHEPARGHVPDRPSEAIHG
jgi:predicted membrane-bound spermidine synthase